MAVISIYDIFGIRENTQQVVFWYYRFFNLPRRLPISSLTLVAIAW
jgi:hypothetical protein